jgi:predicted metal-dependent hydrolase
MMSVWKDKKQFKRRVHYFARKMNVSIKSLTLRSMRTKWASCSTNGALTFNDELLGLETDLGDYVIVHELLHFNVPNHGKLWKSLMAAYLGNYGQIESKLKEIASLNQNASP